jgi:hypothetical protein
MNYVLFEVNSVCCDCRVREKTLRIHSFLEGYSGCGGTGGDGRERGLVRLLDTATATTATAAAATAGARCGVAVHTYD